MLKKTWNQHNAEELRQFDASTVRAPKSLQVTSHLFSHDINYMFIRNVRNGFFCFGSVFKKSDSVRNEFCSVRFGYYTPCPE